MNGKFVMNARGNFCIEVDGRRSRFVGYSSVARLALDPCGECVACREGDDVSCWRPGRLLCGVTASYEGTLPHETIFEVSKPKDLQAIELVEEPSDLRR